MPFTKFANLDFDQIKVSLKDYLRSNSNFTDFDFEGSNLSILVDVLAYNTYITAFNANMIANESFLDSATVRENVVSLARNVGYVPRSKTAAKATISFDVDFESNVTAPTQVVLKSGLVCVGAAENTSYTFSIPDNLIATVPQGESTASFTNIDIFQGTVVKRSFPNIVQETQKFILDNPNIDTSTIRVKVDNITYNVVDNIVEIDKNSRIFLIQEIENSRYEVVFGDGILGKKLDNGSNVEISYIVTDGIDGNGASLFTFAGVLANNLDQLITPFTPISVTTSANASGGEEIESLDSIKYFAPRLYSSQYRAVTSVDYESIIKYVYPNTEAVTVIGGEVLSPPQFGNVFISIKPKDSYRLSDFTKQDILKKIKKYGVIGINHHITDLKVLYVEVDTSVYYNPNRASSPNSIKEKIITSLDKYGKSIQSASSSGRFRYSKAVQLIDNVDNAITSNITKVKMRRNLNCALNNFAQYELCFGNEFHKEIGKYNIKSTGFTVEGETSTCFFVDVAGSGNIGQLAIVKPLEQLDTFEIVKKSVGTVDYKKGEILINTLKITSTQSANGVVEIQAYPESNDVIGLKDLYVIFDINTPANSINMLRDSIVSGEQVSGVDFPISSSYSNGKITR
jgi:hypothetical protein